MTKLRKKVLYTILIILSISALSFVLTYNISKYVEQSKNISNSLNIVLNNKEDKNPIEKPEGQEPSNQDNELLNQEPPDKKELNKIDENTKFMDSVIYTVLIDENDNIKEIINHSNDDTSEEEIKRIANKILKSNKKKSKYIGNLYLNDYSYSYKENNSLVIIDNAKTKKALTTSLISSIVIFILSEIIIYLISRKITAWITIPVKDSFEKQKQFIEDASHELKTPLSVIIASTEALEDNPKEAKWLNNIKSESTRMSNLIKDLLDLASSEKKETYRYQEGNLSKLIELSVLTFEGKAYEKNIKLKYNIDNNIEMKMDENSIRQLIEILLDNAIKHSKDKETIRITLTDNNNEITLKVINKGEGIPKGEEEKIFERFYRVDKSRNRKENRYGLGLAIAKNIVTNHSGKIKAISNNGLTTFEVLFKK